MTEKITARAIVDALMTINAAKICVVEMELFAETGPGTYSRRVDFWTLEVAASKQFRAVAYEIKVSRQDFNRDREEKQRAALSVSDRFFYVAPAGLLKKSDIPTWAGLMEFDGSDFKVIKRAPVLSEKRAPSWELIVSVIRNSVTCRRDVETIREIQRITEGRLNRLKANLRAIEKREAERWHRRWQAGRKAGAP
ncbi:hypothetical protein [Ciceribacter thiooxidans]|uniref:Uncharacterized protein n=1 Tax=Ciceribacter thiooxidans TaxID=1969821 RepID=A0ABV7I0N2_9HYPH|nr:hypothetical protein [Ciceribacter thiooxidans]